MLIQEGTFWQIICKCAASPASIHGKFIASGFHRATCVAIDSAVAVIDDCARRLSNVTIKAILPRFPSLRFANLAHRNTGCQKSDGSYSRVLAECRPLFPIFTTSTSRFARLNQTGMVVLAWSPLYRREGPSTARDSRLIKSHGLSSERKRCRFN